jgi:hypothetical protein
MKLPAMLTLLASVALLAGCVSPRSFVAGQSDIEEVRSRAGLPTDIRFDRNGDELWEYASGPSGFETYLVRIGKDGKVKEVTQLVTEDRMMSIKPDTMTKADARHVLGRPSDESFFNGEATWSWRAKIGAQNGFLVVRFNRDDTVKDWMALIDPSGDGSRDGGK